MPRKRNTPPTTIESIRHQDKRKNIPTEELRDFVAEDEKRPAAILYPRDPSLDPQLVWEKKKETELTGKIPLNPPFSKGDAEGRGISAHIRRGFIYRRVPHITLKSIANNPEIDTIYEKWKTKMDPLLGRLSELMSGAGAAARDSKKAGEVKGSKNMSLEEWQVPREEEDKWPKMPASGFKPLANTPKRRESPRGWRSA
jgi:hypothetical protein